MEYGLIGETLKHSFSPVIHSKIGDYKYEIKEINKEDLDAFMNERDFKGINVTIPYKKAVIPYLSYMDDKAKEIGSINTVVNKDGKLYGYNTDYYGLKSLIEKNHIDIKDRKVLVLGSGGTSLTARAVLKDLFAKEIYVVSRRRTDEYISYEDAYDFHKDADVIINTTPVGMFPDNEGCVIDIDRFNNLSGVVDVVYNPINTKLVTMAKKKGIKACGGLYMLVAQAVYAYRYFFDEEISLKDIDVIYSKIFSLKTNIVLTGMPSSGKTTIGKILKERLNRELVDTDQMIVDKHERVITEIFNNDGEEKFREMETEMVKKASMSSGIIISTGGGAILKDINIDALKSNGIIYFIDRHLDKLIPTSDRPIASDIEAMTKRYNERIDRYRATADYIVSNDAELSTVIEDILRLHFNEDISD